MRPFITITGAVAAASAPVAWANPAPPAPVPPAIPLSPESLDLARRILDITYPIAQRQAQFDTINRVIAGRTRQVATEGVTDPGLIALIDRKTATIPERLAASSARRMIAFMDASARAYARRFSTAELHEILAFAQTPAGTHFMELSPILPNDLEIIPVDQAYANEARDIERQVVSELKTEIRAYVAQHPEAAPK